MKIKHIYYIVFLILFHLTYSVASSQSSVEGGCYIQTYMANDYKAHKQTWSSVQDNRGVMYFANTVGILEYDGNKWRLIKINNQNVAVRYLFTSKSGIVYVGCAANFGYLAPNEFGEIEYVSLVNKIEEEEDKIFSGVNSIFEIGNKIYFAGDNVLFEYDHNTVSAYNIKGLRQTHSVNDRIFMRISGKGLYEFKNGKLELLPNGREYKDIGFMNALSLDNKIIIATFEDGLLVYDGKSISKFRTSLDGVFKKIRITSSTLIDGDIIAIGTFSAGLIFLDKHGEVIKRLDTSLGLKDNLISSIYQDVEGNLWLTGRNISYVLNSVPLSIFDEKYGLNHASRTVLLYNKKLYVGNATGLYRRDWLNEEVNTSAYAKFNQIGIPLNVWNIDTVNGVLLVATNLGVTELYNDQLVHIGDTVGAWKFLRLHNKPNYLIACTNEGLRLLEFKLSKGENNTQTGIWYFKNKIKGFTGRSRHIVIDKSNNIWVANVNNVVKRLFLNKAMNRVSITNYGEQQGILGMGKNYIFNIEDTVLVATNKGIYKYNRENDEFVECERLNKLIGKNTQVLSMEQDDEGNIYYKHVYKKIKQNGDDIYELGKLIKQKDGNYKNFKAPFYRLRNSIYSLNLLPDKQLAIGALKGFVLFKDNNKSYDRPYKAMIRSVQIVSSDSLIFAGAHVDSSGVVCNIQDLENEPIMDFEYNDIMFTFSAPFFDNSYGNKYKFILEGNDKAWSDWKSVNFREYSNLSAGSYVFRVKAKNIYEQESQEAAFRFTIRPPWHQTVWAMLLYLVLLILGIYGIVRLSVRRLRKQKERLEQVVKERTAEILLKNNQLEEKNKTIESKNKSITASITYAKRIQEAMLPLMERIDQSLDDYFILFKPRDIVSGDFYWFAEQDDKLIFTAVDCTGHGVPGAFMSMIGSEILTTIVSKGITKPSEILDMKDKYVKKALKQDKTENQDGMDMSLCTIDPENKIVEWAGAKNPLIYIQNDELIHLKGNPRGIGGYQIISSAGEDEFKNHIISYSHADTYFYIFSDGFQDQFGGPKERKFMIKRLKKIMFDNYKKPMKEQHEIFNTAIEEWMKTTDQTDDILLIGFKLTP